MSEVTAAKIKGYLEKFIEDLLMEYRNKEVQSFKNSKDYLNKSSSEGRLKPFHAAIIPVQFIRMNQFERSFSTKLSSTFEECARLIALDNHPYAERNHKIEGSISESQISEIERLVSFYEKEEQRAAVQSSLSEMINIALLSKVIEKLKRL